MSLGASPLCGTFGSRALGAYRYLPSLLLGCISMHFGNDHLAGFYTA